MTGWADLVRPMATCWVESARGVHRSVDHDEGDAQVVRSYRAPDRWRIETEDGVPFHQSDGERRLVWREDAGPPEEVPGSSAVLSQPDPVWLLSSIPVDDWRPPAHSCSRSTATRSRSDARARRGRRAVRRAHRRRGPPRRPGARGAQVRWTARHRSRPPSDRAQQ